MRRVEDITEALWGTKVSPGTVSELNKKACVHIEQWRNRSLQGGKYPYVYVDGIYLRRNWGGEFENVSILIALGVNEDGYREVIGAAEGMKEDKASWLVFLQWLKERGLNGVRLIVGDKCLGMLDAAAEVFPHSLYDTIRHANSKSLRKLVSKGIMLYSFLRHKDSILPLYYPKIVATHSHAIQRQRRAQEISE